MKNQQLPNFQALCCLLDTNVVIGLLKAQVASMDLLKASNSQLSELAVSQITRLELLGFAGISPKEAQAIQSFLANIQVLPISGKVEVETIALRQSAKIKLPDAIIAGTALAHGLKLLTLDEPLKRVYQAMVTEQ